MFTIVNSVFLKQFYLICRFLLFWSNAKLRYQNSYMHIDQVTFLTFEKGFHIYWGQKIQGMVSFVSTPHRDDGQEISKWWMPLPQLFSQMIVNSKLAGFRKISVLGGQLFTSAAKGELSTDLHGHQLFHPEALLSLMFCPVPTALSLYLFHGPEYLQQMSVPLHVYETEIWQTDSLHCTTP